MIIKKKLNNNAVIALNNKGQEIVVMGRGLAFDSKNGDTVNEKRIERVFITQSDELMQKITLLLDGIDSKYFSVAGTIIDQAKQELAGKISDNLYFSLTDHIHNSVKMYRQGIVLNNPLKWDIESIYPQEYKFGKKALKLINTSFNVQLPEDEATTIAMHLVNALTENGDFGYTSRMTEFIKDIINIIHYTLNLKPEPQSISYLRLVTHLRFLYRRLQTQENQDSGDLLIKDIDQKFPRAYECTRKIQSYVVSQGFPNLSESEKLFLTINIERLNR
ncbi:BglG family transcription antiterminator LicT [Sporolactobacillus sp. THM19-2]|uniref:BglG family transcription antiterminator LicT n=1 Tax=Sporolactobacillus sp. THM19-2 TaxID=2511171 RepID=UPI00101F41E7|nr:PRD domain-containing protein [Sporolactobacillus sp. THM19-2]RYL93968.1 PRD domain-containing protein [Sporolactobacillus sp. THM19-2]